MLGSQDQIIQHAAYFRTKPREKNTLRALETKWQNHCSVLFLSSMKSFLDVHIVKVLPKSPKGVAIAYMHSRWNKITLYATDGKIEIDNNKIENAIRLVALGRENYLFAGSHAAAQRGAIVYSLFACCKINNIDPLKWMESVLRKLPETKTSELDRLLPTKEFAFE
jgi:hypothetical protein